MKNMFRKILSKLVKNKNRSNRTSLPLAPFHTSARKKGQKYKGRPTPLTTGSVRTACRDEDVRPRTPLEKVYYAQRGSTSVPYRDKDVKPRTSLERAYYAQRRTG